MKAIVFGANGTIGKLVTEKLTAQGHSVIKVGKKSGDHQVDLEDAQALKQFYETVGPFDAVVVAAGDVAFAPLTQLGKKEWEFSFGSKLLGQINAVQQAIPMINPQGSFTLVSGVLSDEPIFAGVAASTVNRAIEGFVMAAAAELPKGLRINVVSPGLLIESEAKYGAFFPGFERVSGDKVALAFTKSVLGVGTGKVYAV